MISIGVVFMRESFEKLFKDSKIVRQGELVKFSGIIGGVRKDSNVLITDICLIDNRFNDYAFEDHVWLGTFDYYGENLKELLKCRINKGKKVIFTARVMSYRGKTNYGLKLSRDSMLEII